MPRQVLTVFLSSTAQDLAEHRNAIHDALIRTGWFHCVWQEDFGAQDASAVEFCRKSVADADIFLGLVGLRRGWEPEGDPSKRSITQMEHDWAKECGRRRYLFVVPDTFRPPGHLRDSDAEHARQQTFRQSVMAGGERIVSQQNFDSSALFALDVVNQLLLRTLDLSQATADAARENLERQTILSLARQLKPSDTLDFDQAVATLKNAIEIALDAIARGARGSNADEFVNIILERVGEQTKAGQFDRAASEVDAGLQELDRRDVEQQETLRRSRTTLLEAGIEQDILRRNATAVARRVERLTQIEHSDDYSARFEALRQRQEAYHVEGRDKGINFSLEIAIAIARMEVHPARSAEQRGTALNDLGSALAILGQRESGTARLDEAVTAFREALDVFEDAKASNYIEMARKNLARVEKLLTTRRSPPKQPNLLTGP